MSCSFTLTRLQPLALLFLSVPALSSTVGVAINTSSLSGQSGGIYFQFSPGLNADPASVSISNFALSPPGVLIPRSPLDFSDGGATGSLDAGNLTITNSTALNDYGEALTFGARMTFSIVLNLPAHLTGNSGSELDIQITGADLLTPLLTSDPGGNIIKLSYDVSGALNVLSTSPAAIVTAPTAAPEPGEAWFLFTGLIIMAGVYRHSRCAAT